MINYDDTKYPGDRGGGCYKAAAFSLVLAEFMDIDETLDAYALVLGGHLGTLTPTQAVRLIAEPRLTDLVESMDMGASTFSPRQ